MRLHKVKRVELESFSTCRGRIYQGCIWPVPRKREREEERERETHHQRPAGWNGRGWIFAAISDPSKKGGGNKISYRHLFCHIFFSRKRKVTFHLFFCPVDNLSRSLKKGGLKSFPSDKTTLAASTQPYNASFHLRSDVEILLISLGGWVVQSNLHFSGVAESNCHALKKPMLT